MDRVLVDSASTNLKSAFRNLNFAILMSGLPFALSLVAAVLLATSGFVEAQQKKKVPRIGYVRFIGPPSPLGANVEAFRDELRDLGYVEGTNIVIEYRSADGKPDRVPRLVTELVQLKVDVLISGDDPTIRVFKQATKTIPIVMVIRTQLRQDLSTAWLARAEISRRLADSLGN
jgi:ABC-type uncharacterized transport system substrate-binding protein